jgi:hypothetical protein
VRLLTGLTRCVGRTGCPAPFPAGHQIIPRFRCSDFVSRGIVALCMKFRARQYNCNKIIMHVVELRSRLNLVPEMPTRESQNHPLHSTLHHVINPISLVEYTHNPLKPHSSQYTPSRPIIPMAPLPYPIINRCRGRPIRTRTKTDRGILTSNR